MPRPVFDIQEYELRGVVPPVYSKAQKEKLNTTLTRVNGQIDWTAQLLGFSGPNYWGLANPKDDGSYDWKGLVETMNEKRQMQVGAYGIYNKNLDYENWPSPFNRSELKASGDFSFSIYEENDATVVAPLGMAVGQDFREKPYLYLNAQYLFRGQVEITYSGEFFLSYETIADEVWTRFRPTTFHETLEVKLVDSDATPFTFIVLQWRDISDWNYDDIKRNFIGIWGNKGNQLSHDFAFDALDLHGFNELYGLTQSKTIVVPFEDLIALAGLTVTDIANIPYDQISINVEDCGEFTLDPPNSGQTENEFLRCENCNFSLIGTQIFSGVEGNTGDLLIEMQQTNEIVATDPNTLDLETEDKDASAMGFIVFQYTANNACGSLDFPSVSISFNIDVDNGTLESVVEPWATIVNGIYDQVLGCIDGNGDCGEAFCGFDNGTYDGDFPDEQEIKICITDYLKSYITYSMVPNLENSYTPLRLWKPQVLTTMDELSYEGQNYWNPLIADYNTGPFPEDNYRHYVRLPLEYVRNGKQWQRATAVCNNLSYFSAPPNESETELEIPVTRPVLYDEYYYKTDLPESTTYYNEDYLVSTIREDNEPVQAFFQDSAITFESDELIPFYKFAKISTYDPFDYRVANVVTTNWEGDYYIRETPDMNLTLSGFLATDLEGHILEELPESMDPVWDAPRLKYPNEEFPDTNDKAHVKNYVVSYAYFVTDYSASDEPVFDPDAPHCWRDPCFDCISQNEAEIIPSQDPLATEVPEDMQTDPDADLILVNSPGTFTRPPVDCGNEVSTNLTAYLLHDYTCT